MKVSAAVAVCAWLALAGVCGAQPPAITAAMIATSLPLKGAPRAQPVHGAPGPTSLDRFAQQATLPVVAWGNSGRARSSPGHAGFLTPLTSHGFLVITPAAAPGPRPGALPRRQATAADLRAAVDKIQTRRVAVMSPRVTPIGVASSGPDPADPGGRPVGAQCGLCTHPGWDLASKRLGG